MASGDAELVVTELCANVVRHTDDATMNVELLISEEVLVAVRDGLSADLRAKAAEGDAESGRGLLIVEALATRWGVNRTSDGKRVWATLSQEAC